MTLQTSAPRTPGAPTAAPTPAPTPAPTVAAGRRSRLARALPALTLGLSALALALPTTLPADAAPTASKPAASKPAARASSAPALTRPAAVVPATTQHLTVEARRAGLEVGNATMGWKARGVERSLPAVRREMSTRSTPAPFTPKGVLGVDVSSYQREVVWSTWTARNRQFAYIKATEGTTYRSRYFLSQYRSAKRAGLVRGAYHFASPNGKPGSVQARYFVANGGRWTADGKTLPGVLDVEYNPYGPTCYGLTPKKMLSWITSFTDEYKRLTGKDAVIYTTADWWKQCTGDSNRYAKTNPLWIARYGTTTPGTLPKGYTYATFWQYSSVPIDQDVFGSRLARLKVLATER